MHRTNIVALLAFAGALSACGAGDSAPSSGAATPTPAAVPAEPAEPATPVTAPVAADPVAGTPTPPPAGETAPR